MDLHAQYQRALQQPGFEADPAQRAALDRLQSLGERLLQPVDKRLRQPVVKGWLNSLFGNGQHTQRGLYLWGGVGRGKTWLMDLFFAALPFEQKLRLHFRHFMQEIHDKLTQLAGHRDPLPLVAKHFARRARVLCLDEFFVEDITDAMILHRLLDALIKQGVALVFTSNLAPAELYLHGLQRERFLPAIALIEAHTEVIELAGDTDHRLRKLQQAHCYFSPLNAASQRALAQRFTELAPGTICKDVLLNINHRQIPCQQCADDVAWFDFLQLCHGPRASADYIELARRFHTVCIANVPSMGEHEEEWAHRFIDLVDEFYDRRVKLLISADNDPAHLYHGRRHVFDFQRTASRLMEMRSDEYLAQAHRP
ncbi:MAG TPA: cell division protein ZapE [Gammaproteobacteria bacterium]|nr:cell division protein ZapE [Gammaproteobacteria bacterium]